MSHQVFLGGACGTTTWRKEIAIPILSSSSIGFYDPQMGEGEWTPSHQCAEMEAKDAADVWLFVINEATRGIASIVEVAYRIGQDRRIALCLVMLPYGIHFEGRQLPDCEVDDLNRGRVFLKAMAEEHGIPVFTEVAAAAHHAVMLAREADLEMNLKRLKAILQKVEAGGHAFLSGCIADCFWVQISSLVKKVETGEKEQMTGRRWLIAPTATEGEVVRTLLKAALTWDEHEAREQFKFDGQRLFTPHFNLKP